MRKIITAGDVAVLFGKSRRQASRILKAVKAALGKEDHQFVTVREFAAHYGITVDEIEQVIFFNDH